MTNQTTKKPIKDLVEKKDATNDSELKSSELNEVSGGRISTSGVTTIGGVASKTTTQVTEE
jgi:hypothetical protein